MPSSPHWALVTGVSAGGMGDGHVQAFLRRGVNVVATNIDMKLMEYLPRDESATPKLVQVQLDVTSKESIDAAVEKVREITSGRLDWLMSTPLPF